MEVNKIMTTDKENIENLEDYWQNPKTCQDKDREMSTCPDCSVCAYSGFEDY